MSKSSLLALTGVGLAIAGAAAWMMLCSGSSDTSSTSAQVAAPTPAPLAVAAQHTPAPVATPPASTPKPAPAPVAAAQAPVAAGQQAFIDPATGKLRPAEHDEVAALNAKGAAGARRLARAAQVANEPQEFPTEGGAMGVVVPDELQPYTVATKTPDGRVVIEHVTGGKAAVKKVHENTKNGGMVQRKGESNDR
jgi:hypothetical protein